MRTIKLPAYCIELSIDDANPVPGSITCSPALYETCSHCGNKICCYQCDGSTAGGRGSDEDDVRGRLAYNGAVDGILATILAHAMAGIDVETPAYLEGIETALQASGENL